MTDQKKILDELKNIRKDINILTNKINKLNKSCSRMDNHISFVENTYDILRSPLSIVSNLITNTFSYQISENKLPKLKNKN